MAIDPVCGMEVDEKTAAGKTKYKGKTYYFFAPGCKSAFDKNETIKNRGLPCKGQAFYSLRHIRIPTAEHITQFSVKCLCPCL